MANANEEPAYEVVSGNDIYELRYYEPMLVAETVVDGSFSSAGNKAFRILASYIFGNNRPQVKMAMTAPVISRAGQPESDNPEGEKMAMTAPVLSQELSGQQRHIFQFVMERKYTRASLPEPLDPRVSVKEQPARIVAAHRFGGTWSEKNVQEHKVALLNALSRDGIRVTGSPQLARYDAPFKPWFLRRNEILVEVEDTEAHKK